MSNICYYQSAFHILEAGKTSFFVENRLKMEQLGGNLKLKQNEIFLIEMDGL